MTLQSSGQIAISNINTELGAAGTTNATLGQSTFRTLAGVPSGTIRMSNFYGKSNWKYAGIINMLGRWFDTDQHYIFIYIGGGQPGNYFELRLIYTSVAGQPLGNVGLHSSYLDSYGTNGGDSGSSGDVYTISLTDPFWPRWSTQPGNYVLNRFQIWQRNPTGTLVAGDIFDLYRDPTTDPYDIA